MEARPAPYGLPGQAEVLQLSAHAGGRQHGDMYSHPNLASAPGSTIGSSTVSPSSGQRARHAVCLPLLPADPGAAPVAPPEWVELIPAGAFVGRDGRGPYTLDAKAVLATFERGGIDLPIDYDHQTLEADAKAGPAPAERVTFRSHLVADYAADLFGGEPAQP